MSDSGKKLRDLAGGSISSIGTTSALDRALKMQRSVEKLTASDLLRDDRFTRSARGLPSREIEREMDIVSGKLGGVHALSKHISVLDQAKLNGFKLHDSFEKYGAMRNILQEAIGKANGFEGTAFGRAHETAATLAALNEHSFGKGIHSRMEESIRRMMGSDAALTARQSAMLGIDRDTASAFARTRHWADTLSGSSARDYAKLLGTDDRYSKQFDALNLAAGSITAATAELFGGSFASRFGALKGNFSDLSATATKMSLFAGSLDVLGPGTSGNQAAYKALLGGYSTPTMLDRVYWRDPRERARYYRDQEVDDGLIDADNAATVAVLIESGVVEGKLTRAGTITAVVEAGPVKVQIMASRPKLGAFGAIDAFESGLRGFVAAKLLAAQGVNWFKQRVPGEIVQRAKDRRREAIRAGEASLDLIYYTDLGDLIGVVTRNDNWSELFEAVFDRKEWLKVDIERLNASRRPTMHSRPIDPVQLCEIVLTIRRLVGWMECDGAWDVGWDSDV
jgi:hypothetical protein